jgi:hypothetical protein
MLAAVQVQLAGRLGRAYHAASRAGRTPNEAGIHVHADDGAVQRAGLRRERRQQPLELPVSHGVYAVVDESLSLTRPLGDAIDTLRPARGL